MFKIIFCFALWAGPSAAFWPIESSAIPVASSSCQPFESMVVGVAHLGDIPSVSKLLVDAYGYGGVDLGADFSEFERQILGYPVGVFNDALRELATAEAAYGIKTRAGSRMTESGVVDLGLGSPTSRRPESLLLVVMPHGSMTPVATAEIAFEIPQNRLPSNTPNPWRPDPVLKDLRPYVCNVAVAEAARRKKIGTNLLRLCEQIARRHWDFDEIYLHVDPSKDDAAALKLYTSLGYENVPELNICPGPLDRALGMPSLISMKKQLP